MSDFPSVRLQALADRYSGDGAEPPGEAFLHAFQRYLQQNRESLFDLTLAATSASVESAIVGGHVDPTLLKAIQTTNPELSEAHFFALSDEEKMGVINSAKGKYFEYLVEQKLNHGDQVGAIALPHGYRAELAHSLTQPGWDIRIFDDHNHIADYLQLKATDSAGYIKETLKRYPDIKILTTDEVGHFADHGGLVFDSGISNDHLQTQVQHAVDSLDVSVMHTFIEYFNPLIPMAVIVGIEGYKLGKGYKLGIGRESLEGFRLALLRRGQRVVATKLAGAIVYVLGGGLWSIPAAFAGGLWFDHTINRTAIAVAFEEHRSRLLSMRLYQQERLLRQGLA